jgi:hypothetical protein
MKYKIIYVLLAVWSIPMVSETNNASSGLSFLKLGVGARAIAMGEAYGALSDDASGIYYNPAGIAFGETNEVTVMHKQWAFGTATEFLGSTVHASPFTFGFGFNSTNVNGIEIRQQPGPAQGTFGLRDLAISATASWRIDTNLSLGATAKFLYEKIYVDESNGAAFDFGVRYQYSHSLAFAIAVSNLGSMSKLVSDPITLPTVFRGGVSFFSPLNDDFSATIASDLLKVVHDNGVRIHAGGEISYRSLLAIRTGYQIGYDAKSFSAGLGVRYSLLQFDYAFVPFSNQLGDTHTFALTFNL